MPYVTTHEGIEIKYERMPDGSVNLQISEEFSLDFFLDAPPKLGKVTIIKKDDKVINVN